MQVRIMPRRQENQQQASFPAFSPSSLFDEFYRDLMSRYTSPQAEGWKPPVDILEKDGNLYLRAELAGIDEKDIDLKLEGNVLTIRGERKQTSESDGFTSYQTECCYGPFSRSFTIPESVDPAKISAQFKNGILTVTLPQKPEVKPRSIKVNV